MTFRAESSVCAHHAMPLTMIANVVDAMPCRRKTG